MAGYESDDDIRSAIVAVWRYDQCGPASCVSMLSFWGIDATEGEMARLCRTRGDGTTTFNAFRGLKQRLRGTNLRTRVIEMNEQRFRNINVPVLFCQKGHAFVMVYDGQKVTVLDPLLRSATQVSIDHVLSDLSGATVVVLPPPEDRRRTTATAVSTPEAEHLRRKAY